MVEIDVAIRSDKALKTLNKLMHKMPELTVRPLSVAVQYIGGVAQDKYLRGPRPLHLAVASGDLRKSISTTVILKGKVAEGHVGTNQIAPKGFNYPEFWEFKGRGGNPRPFLRPARDRYRDKWTKLFVDEFKKELYRWIEANK
jgi:hypothetical protein